MRIGNKEFDTKNHTYIMGILNVTPDSFSDGGQHNKLDEAILHAKRMIEEGADIIDVGGESTRPGYVRISDEEEIERTLPVIERIKAEFDTVVSIDTYKPAVAKAAIGAGVDLINDISGLMFDPMMGKLVAESDVALCLMHNRKEHDYVDFATDFFTDMSVLLNMTEKAGISADRIILDPGVGFAKTTEENLYVLNNMDLILHLGCPYLLGASRKSVVGNTLKLPVDERLEGTLATTAIAIEKGASFVRVHDVKENKRFITMMEAIRNAKL